MTNVKRPRGYWTKENVFAEGKKHKNRRAWQLAQSRSYNIAWENNWLDEIIGREIVHGSWTKDAVLLSGLQFITKTAWRNSSQGSAYVIAKRNGWLKELLHFEKEFSFGERTIYKYLLSKNVAFEMEKTFASLRDRYPLRFDFWVPSSNLLIEYQGRQHKLGWGGDAIDAGKIKKRDNIKKIFAKENGFVLILIEEATVESIHKILDINIRSNKNRTLTSEELSKIKNIGGWSKERALVDAKKYKTRKEWDKASHGYAYARLNNFLDEACFHMLRENAWTKSRKRKWEKAMVIEDAKKYKRPGEWKKNSPSAYAISLRSGWHAEATEHMR